MANTSMCLGTDCPVKDRCYRFTAPKSEKYQDYLKSVPFRRENGKIECDLFIRDRRPKPVK